jgi:hypothetical protein
MEANPAPNTPRGFLELISDQDVSGEIPWSLFTCVRQRGHQVGEQNGASISSLVTVRSSVESASAKFPPQHPRSKAPGLVTAADIIEYTLDSAPARDATATGYLERYVHGEITGRVQT